MLKTVKVQEAKTHLSNLPARDWGFVPYDVPESFFDELPESEVGLWES